MNGNKVLVTGGFGNLGSYISKHLINLNYDVSILTRKEKNKLNNLKYKVIECDITNLKELKLKLKNFDLCVHCASFNEHFSKDYLTKALKINSFGTRNLLEALDLKKLKNFVYFSTFHVYGKISGVIDERTKTNPKNDYALTHLFAEYYLGQFNSSNNLKYTILRLTNSFGEPSFIDTNKWYLVINNLVKMAFEKKKIILNSNGKPKRDFIGMNDVATITEEILKVSATNEIYNLSSNKTFEVAEIANIVKKVYEKRYNANIEIKKNINDKNEYANLVVQNQKLRNLIKFELNDSLENEINKIFNRLEEISN